MLPSFAKQTVTVWRAPLVEERGVKVRDWAAAEPHAVAGCSVQPGDTSATWGEPRNGATIRATLYAPPGADIERTDRVEFAGVRYAVDGAPVEWQSPTGRASHMVCKLIDWEG